MARDWRQKSHEVARREAAAFDREQRRFREERLQRVARDNPDLNLSLLAERFGTDESEISYVLSKAGMSREPDFFSNGSSTWTPQPRLSWRERAKRAVAHA